MEVYKQNLTTMQLIIYVSNLFLFCPCLFVIFKLLHQKWKRRSRQLVGFKLYEHVLISQFIGNFHLISLVWLSYFKLVCLSFTCLYSDVIVYKQPKIKSEFTFEDSNFTLCSRLKAAVAERKLDGRSIGLFSRNFDGSQDLGDAADTVR